MRRKKILIIVMIVVFVSMLFVGIVLYYQKRVDDRSKASTGDLIPNDNYKTWTINSANSALYTYDSNLLTLDATGAVPKNVSNKFSSNPYFSSTDISNWKLGVIPPAGWVDVPVGTSTSAPQDFIAMKYEAKCATTSAPTVGLTTSGDTTKGIYQDTGSATPANNCTSVNNKQVVSLPGGFPIADINQTDAAARCSSIVMDGQPMHLITNSEWMAIVNNAENQGVNWSNGTVGNGYLYAGHNDGSPNTALIASSNDAYRGAYTDTNGTTESISTPTYKANGNSATQGAQIRTFTLSNGQVIWDIAGNLKEWVNNTIQSKDEPNASKNNAVVTGTSLSEYSTSINSVNHISSYKTGSTLQKVDAVGNLNSSYTSAYGVGKIIHNSNSTDAAVYGYQRGGAYNNSLNTGAYSLDVTNLLTNWDDDALGFRCASAPVGISEVYSDATGTGNDVVTNGSITDGKLTQLVTIGNNDTSEYDLKAYVYNNTTGQNGLAVTANDAQLWYNGAPIKTQYIDASSVIGAGWWKLLGIVKAPDTAIANKATEYGVLVKAGKTLRFDDFSLTKEVTLFNKYGYANDQVSNWNQFCNGVISGSDCTKDSYKPRTNIRYEFCDGDGATCEANSTWKSYNGSTWVTASSMLDSINAGSLNQDVMRLLPTTSKTISFKAYYIFEGNTASADLPRSTKISIGLTTGTNSSTATSVSISSETSASTTSSTSSSGSSGGVSSSNISSSGINNSLSDGGSSCKLYDFNNDAKVDILDFAKWVTCYRLTGADQIAQRNCGFADVVKDNKIDITDFAAFVVAYNKFQSAPGKACSN